MKKTDRQDSNSTDVKSRGKQATSSKKSIPQRSPWYAEGLRFECQGSGQCCVSHGEYGFVYVTKADRVRMAKLRGLTTADFTRKYCLKEEGLYRLRDGEPIDPKTWKSKSEIAKDREKVDEKKLAKPCIFLANKRCAIYEARPTQCRTWPFWPETMNPKSWKKDVVSFCAGANKGRVWSHEEIESLLKVQTQWENDVAHVR